MKKNYLLLIVLFICIAGKIHAQSPDWLWAKGMQDPAGTSGGSGMALARDAFGNIYTTGGFDGTIDFDPGPGVFLLTGGGAFITKLDSSGNFIWAKAMTGMCGFRSIALDDSCNIYVGGSLNDTADFDPGPGTFNLTSAGWSDICFAKYDSSGNFNWANRIGGISFDYCTTIIIGKGEVYIAGGFGNATVDFDPGPGTFYLTAAGNYCMYIAKFNSSGNFIWAKAAGAYNSWINSMAFDSTGSGDMYISGGFSFTVDFDMGAGVFNLTSVGATPLFAKSDIFICKLDSMGNFIWAKAMGGPGFDEAYSLAVNTYGDVYSTGYFNDSADFDPGAGTFNLTSHGGDDIFISKLDNSGNFIWTKAIGGIDYDASSSLALDLPGGEDVYFTGTFVDTVDFDPGAGVFNLTSDIFGDIYVARLDSAGNFVWAKQAGGAGTLESSMCIVLDAFGNAYTTGNFYGNTCTFGPFTLINTGTNNEIYIARLNAVISTGINEIIPFAKEIFIFPNPATNYFIITLEASNKSTGIIISDLNGKVMYSTAASGTQNIKVNTKDFAQGVYVVQIQTGEFLKMAKLIVAK